ncbi:MAG: response regulator transcription factor [Saprospiraceae bacterium]|nr:response regulator transcription factor [Saprospiraceae bacterium]
MDNARIIVADAQFLVRYAIREILKNESGLDIIAEVTNEDSLLMRIDESEPDIIIIDYNQPGHFTPLTIKNVLEKLSPQQVMVITSDTDKQSMLLILESGIQTFITKNCDDKEVLDATRANLKGEKFFCSQVIDLLLERSFSRTKESSNERRAISTREIQVVQLIAQGFTAKEIGASLNLSTHTIYTHRRNIMRKLSLSSSSELILYAVEQGLIKGK